MPVYNPLMGGPLPMGDYGSPQANGHPVTANAMERDSKMNMRKGGDAATSAAFLVTAAIVTLASFHFLGVRASISVGS